MSGTSLDGLDVAYCVFHHLKGQWSFHVPIAKTYTYTPEWHEKLRKVHEKEAYSFVKTHKEFGHLIGLTVNEFCNEHNLNPLIISSHGHTVFHRPEENITFQIGCGAQIAALTKKKVVCDFRSLDVAKNGQGAPLVPMGDLILFSDYDMCINLGGFANVSFDLNDKRIAFDICPFNIILNLIYANAPIQSNLPYDKGGEYASGGTIINGLLSQLNALAFYSQKPPKSLGREWLDSFFIQIIEKYKSEKAQNIMCTIAEHCAIQISKVINTKKTPQKILCTGGGAYNTFIIDLIKYKCPSHQIIVPAPQIVEFKEALIFAFLGLLRHLESVNCISTVTGSNSNSSLGCIYDGQNY